MEVGGADGETVHRRDAFLCYLAALAHTCDDQFAIVLRRTCDSVDCVRKVSPGGLVGGIDVGEVGEGISFRGEDMQG